jgi:formylglycine-generating enzyme required for sulfatase activity
MKNRLFLKLGIAIVVGFGLMIAGFYIWKQVQVKYYSDRYASPDVKVRLAVVDELCALGGKGKEIMREIFRERCKQEMVPIPAGSFMMGSEKGNEDEKPVHEVMLSAFWMDKYEVTNEKYYVFVKCTNYKQPDHWKLGRIPADRELHAVVCVSWNDAVAYVKWIGMHLPTEAEWEYACRAGSTTEYCFGDNADELGEYAWSYNNWVESSQVGQKKPNKWGVFDMHGNVLEWCQDKYDNYKNSPTDNPTCQSEGIGRVKRGGSRGYVNYDCRSARRFWCFGDDWFGGVGFRVARSSGE